MNRPPIFTVIAGPNGAGKSTLVDKLDEQGQTYGPFINPDVIARNLDGVEDAHRDMAAGREALRQTKARIDAKEDFSRESTLSSNEILKTMKRAHDAGFQVHMEYVGVKSLEYAKHRVANRAALGGHDIPVEVQERRYNVSLSNAAKAAKFVDKATFRDNSGVDGHRMVATVEQGRVTWLAKEQPRWLETALKDIPRSPSVKKGLDRDNSDHIPSVYMIAGPNGAGKSTLYEKRIKPGTDAPFINADRIQKLEMTDQSAEGAYEAARIAEARRQTFLAERSDFVTESTFSHPSKNKLLEQARLSGYKVTVLHVNVRSENLSVARVAARVKEGGHNVPEHKIRERYHRNQELIREAVVNADQAYVYDNSIRGQAPKAIITFENGRAVQASDKMPQWARELYAQELRSFSPARLNEAAESFRQLGNIAKEQIDPRAKVLVPTGRQTYHGKIVGESGLHALQQTRDGKLYGHFKTSP